MHIDKAFVDAVQDLVVAPDVVILGEDTDKRHVLSVPAGDGKFNIITLSDLAVRDAANEIAERKARDVGFPPTLKLATLTGLCAWLTKNLEGIPLNEITVHVTSPMSVVVFETPDAFERRRVIVTADCSDFTPVIEFSGKRMDLERFNIMLQSNFAQTAMRDEVLKVIGNTTESEARTIADTGIAQKVTVKSSIGPLENTTVPNPVRLAPFRTFRDIAQPESPFVLRLHGGEDGRSKPEASLHEADGGYWKHAAMQEIAAWLSEALSVLEGFDVDQIIA